MSEYIFTMPRFHSSNSSRIFKARPKHLAVCTKTSGFAVVASNNRVIRQGIPGRVECSPMPQPCVLVSFEVKDCDCLLAVSIDGTPRSHQILCDSIDWTKDVTGLHCDSQLQLVFVAQLGTVTVMDLSGIVSEQLNAASFGFESPCHLCAIAGNADNIFLLDRNSTRLLVRNKRAPKNYLVVSLSSQPMLIGSDLGSLAVSGDRLFVCDNRTGRVFKLLFELCSVRVIQHSAEIGSPLMCQIAADSSGHVIVSAFVSNSVTVLDKDGTVLRTLTGDKNSPFHFPCGVSVLESGDGTVALAVSDLCNRRIVILTDLSEAAYFISDFCSKFSSFVF